MLQTIALVMVNATLLAIATVRWDGVALLVMNVLPIITALIATHVPLSSCTCFNFSYVYLLRL